MNFAKTIEMLLVDGTANGLILASMKNWNGKAIKIPRNEVSKYSKDELKKPGVYLLFCEDEDLAESVYVGESEDVLNRLKEHIQDNNSGKENYYWNTAIAFTSDELNKTTIRFLENALVEKIKVAKTYKLLTKNTYAQTKISEADEAAMEEFIYNLEIIINALGYRIFKPTNDTNEKVDMFYLSGVGADAKGYVSNGGFVVLKDSVISDHTVDSFEKYCIKSSEKRNKLIEDGVIVDRTFTVDYEFTSPSAASDVILGRSSNGLQDWKNKNKKSLKDCK